jgi:two-component system, NarL family, sensor kinase
MSKNRLYLELLMMPEINILLKRSLAILLIIISNRYFGQTASYHLKLADSLKYISPDEALGLAAKALEAAKISADKKSVAFALSLMGTIKCIQGDFTNSYQDHLEALKLSEAEKDSAAILNGYNNIGMVLDNSGKDSAALSFFLKAIAIQERISQRKELIRPYNNLGVLYTSLNERSKAIVYFEKAAALAQEYQLWDIEGSIKHNIALIYMADGDNSKALHLLMQSLQVHGKTNNDRGKASNLLYLGKTFFVLGDNEKGLDHIRKTLDLSKEKGFKDILSECYLELSLFYERDKQMEKALENLKLWAKTEEGIISETSVSQMAEMQTKYETEKKEKENLELKRRNEVQELVILNENQKRKNQLTIAASLVVLIGASSFLLYNRKKHQQKVAHAAKLAHAEKVRFREVIEAEEKERSRIAQELHDGLGQLLSTARLNVASLEEAVSKEDALDVERSLRIIDEACIEIRNISHNMMPSALSRLGLAPALTELVSNVNASDQLKINFTSHINFSLGRSLDITLYRIIQEIVNNMLKHSRASLINLKIEQEEHKLQVMLEDNGIGFDTKEIGRSKGIGWKNIFSRVAMLNGTIEIESEFQKGTKIIINLVIRDGQ